MQIETWPLDRLIPYEHNPRINDQAVDTVARSIEEFGFRQPIVVDEAGVIIIGHTRLPALETDTAGTKRFVRDFDPLGPAIRIGSIAAVSLEL